MAERGELRVLLGMAPGVGKTYRMLEEGHFESTGGRDVVIAYLEPHDRPETLAQAEGLEMVPRKLVSYGTAELPEMDLDAVLERKPEIALVDELAHTNARGSPNPKRWQDVEVLLDAGIDVISTVNVQHLESLNDQIADLTGVRVRETLPDAVLADADEVVVIDLTPEDLIDRLLDGKVYPGTSIEAALNSFFRIENLSALREVALRQVAEDVGSRRLVTLAPLGTRDPSPETMPQAVAERLLALVTPELDSQRLIRRSWRSAQRLKCELDLLWVSPTHGSHDDETAARLDAMQRLCSVLGTQLIVERSDDLVLAVKRVVAERGTTYIQLGTPRRRTGLARLRPSLVDRLIEELPGIDIRIISTRKRREADSQ
jgi:two-component system sensor histidine kinase KdpD